MEGTNVKILQPCFTLIRKEGHLILDQISFSQKVFQYFTEILIVNSKRKNIFVRLYIDICIL